MSPWSWPVRRASPTRRSGWAQTVRATCSGLGARVATCPITGADGDGLSEEQIEREVEASLSESGGADLLVVDAAGVFAAAGGREALGLCTQASWDVTRAVAKGAMLEDGGGLVVLIAPAPDAGEHADPALAALENLARTLSIEWARFGTRVVTIAPGAATRPEEVATLVAYLASPAGAYFSGCLLDLRAS